MIRNSKTRIEDLRRTELIDAAHRVFMLHGLSGMTTARICAEAGMSPGILSYYFKGKDEVLYAMVRKNNRALVEDVVHRLRQARTQKERLFAVIEGNFPRPIFTATSRTPGCRSVPPRRPGRTMPGCSASSIAGWPRTSRRR